MEKQKDNKITNLFYSLTKFIIIMKKMIIACAVVLAACLSSCGDTNYCYEVTTKLPTLTGGTHEEIIYLWTTSNELDAWKEQYIKTKEAIGISKDAIKITAKRTNKSQSDCY